MVALARSTERLEDEIGTHCTRGFESLGCIELCVATESSSRAKPVMVKHRALSFCLRHGE